MARVLLQQAWNGHAAGEIVDIDGGRASVLILNRVGVLAPAVSAIVGGPIDVITNAIADFKAAVAVINEQELSDEEHQGLVTLTKAFVAPLNDFVAAETDPYDSLQESIPALSIRLSELLTDEEADPDKVNALSEALKLFVEPYAKLFWPSPDQQTCETEIIKTPNEVREEHGLPPVIPIEKMNHEQLTKYAEGLGITVPENATKADIKKLIADHK